MFKRYLFEEKNKKNNSEKQGLVNRCNNNSTTKQTEKERNTIKNIKEGKGNVCGQLVLL